VDTLDVRDLPDAQVQWLQRIVDGLKAQAKTRARRHDEKITFATHKSHLIGGYSRAAAYEDQ
jgi:hypothetical protein